MNGTDAKIELIKPFEEAFRLMKQILFQPFELKKWFVIGFAAWLAQIGAGGGVNYRYGRGSDFRHNPALQQFFGSIRQIPKGILISGVSAAVIIIIALMVVFA